MQENLHKTIKKKLKLAHTATYKPVYKPILFTKKSFQEVIYAYNPDSKSQNLPFEGMKGRLLWLAVLIKSFW